MHKVVRFITLCAVSFAAGAFFSHHDDPAQPLTAEMADVASRVFGIPFTRAERDSMLDNLNDQRKDFETIRAVDLKNDVAPALYFNPLPTGFQLPKGPDSFAASAVGQVRMPANRDELAFYTVAQLGELIRTRQVSSEDLTRFFLNRLKTYGPRLFNVITLTEELALEQARRADAELKAGNYRGALHGIPYGAKDLLARRGYKTTWGSVPYKEQTLNYDATVVKRLEEAGAVLCAKLAVGELAWGDVWFGGMSRNPWKPETGSSGSSAGSGSTVSAGLLPFAIGTETLGSIVSPSTVCGVTGLRPTFGRVSRHGAMALAWSMDKIGPMTRSVEDCALVFRAIQGPDGFDPTVVKTPFNYAALPSLKGVRIGIVQKAFDSEYPNKTNDQATLETLRKLGATFVPIELPPFRYGALSLIIGVEGGAAFDELTRSGRDDQMVRQMKAAWPNEFRSARFIPAIEYVQANRIRTQLINQMYDVLKKAKVDVYVTPTYAGGNLTLTNLTGHPCVVLPNGFNAAKTPTSITFNGQLFAEGRLLAVAKAYQDATDWHKKHPVLN
ncbi:Amidase [Fibrella aestuarina BUZ 2]|uniref:Amidase n=1 Tax=Fibrella aestuarina BUZ 2 TaxID=1166018 RepID=I0KFU4_9BACT|nr:amidase [Fibrella aestuarina]CCH02997.1 Amidase [Fibrella aestuarina BUZ 2]